ncbi:MAG: ABC transporter permease [Bacteroidota bacterium]
MLHLLQLEWKKQKGYILFRLLAIAYFILMPAVLLALKKIFDNNYPDGGAGDALPFDPRKMLVQFPTVWNWFGYIGNWLVFFVLGFLAVLLITNEHSNRTLRQNIITGLHRTEFFLSKLYFMFAISLAATVYYALCSLAIGFSHTETIYTSTVLKNWDMMPRYFLMCLGYMSFGLLIGALVKRMGIALFVYLAYVIFLEPVLRWAVHFNYFKNEYFKYYPLNMIEDLCPVPFFDQADNFLKQNNFTLFLPASHAVIGASICIALFFWLTHRRLKTGDL